MLSALREGATQGNIRTDIEPEILLVLVSGTIHALIGMPGIHQRATRKQYRNRNRVLDALIRRLSPPVGNTGQAT